MKTTKEQALLNIAAAFTDQMAGQYQLPELRGAGFQVKRLGDGFSATTEQVKATPTGQLSGIVSELSVRVEVTMTDDTKFTRGTIHYSYGHHSRGSNGSEQVFEIVTESHYDEFPTYAGCISENLLYRHNQNMRAARAERAAQNTAKA